MSGERVVVKLGEICPHLGIADDPAVRCLGASSYNRCHSDSRPRLIGTDYQADFCLSGSHSSCSRWHSSEEDTSVVEGVGYLFGWDGQLLRRAASDVVRHLGSGLIGLAWMALAVTAVVLLAPLLTAANPGARAGSLPAREMPANAARAEATAPAGQDAPALMVLHPAEEPASGEAGSQDVPVSESHAAPAEAAALVADHPPAAEKAPYSPASGEETHVVQAKDTLWSLARAHGVTVDDIMKANGLSNRDYIRTGQTIIIPQP